MLKYKFIFFLQVIILLGIFSTAEAVKPRPPLQLSLLEVDLSGKQSQLTLMATANIDSDQVKLSFDLPGGLSFVKGEEEWEGALKKGESKKIEIIVENQIQKSQKVTGKATLHLNGGETFLQQNTITLGDPKEKSSPPPPAPSVKRKQGEENILEFKGK
jgi:hypothetical protein